MQIRRITDWAELAPLAERWDELAGCVVFRNWIWQSTWWKHYGCSHELFVLLVLEEETSSDCQAEPQCSEAIVPPERVVAILPCYLETDLVKGRVLRLLGDGEVCSDYLDLLADPAHEHRAVQTVARYLCEHSHLWDTTEFTAIGAECRGLNRLSSELEALGCCVSRKPNENCWAIPLPEDWEAFLALQSKSHRKQLRQLEKRVLKTEQAKWHLAETQDELEVAWPLLIDLHQRRRRSLGEPGCFASEQWTEFHAEVARRLLDLGLLRLSWLEIAGTPVAAEYHFAGPTTTWAYQGGVDPDRIDEEPGRLSMILTLQHAMNEGHSQLDLLRGDEPYKAHWRAEPQATYDLQIVPARRSARWRSQACNVAQRTARLAKQITNLLS